jgi:hypothetical protein
MSVSPMHAEASAMKSERPPRREDAKETPRVWGAARGGSEWGDETAASQRRLARERREEGERGSNIFREAVDMEGMQRERSTEPSVAADDVARVVVDSAVKVHRALGPGFGESVYEAALCHELGVRGLRFERQAVVRVTYRSLARPDPQLRRRPDEGGHSTRRVLQSLRRRSLRPVGSRCTPKRLRRLCVWRPLALSLSSSLR